MPDAVDLLTQSGRTIDATRMAGWRVDVGYPGDRAAVVGDENRLLALDLRSKRVRLGIRSSGLRRYYSVD